MNYDMKVRLRGMKQKIVFLGYNEEITPDCFQAITGTSTGWKFDKRTEEEYNQFVEYLKKNPYRFNNYRWEKSGVWNEMDRPCDCHSHRTYFKVVE